MNELLNSPIDNKKAKKVFTITLLLFCLLPILLNALCLVPLYAIISANVSYTVLSQVLDYVLDVFDIIAFAVPYALMIFSVLLLTRKQARSVMIFYIFAFAARIPCRLIMNVFLYKTLGSATDIIIDVIYLLVYYIFEVLQLFIVYWFATTDSSRYLLHISNLKKSKKQKKGMGPEIKHVIPFAKFLDWYNPLQRSALKMGILIYAVKICTRILNDIIIGAPTSFGEVLVMIAYYLSDILYGLVAYIIALLVFTVIYEKSKAKKEADEEASPSVLD